MEKAGPRLRRVESKRVFFVLNRSEEGRVVWMGGMFFFARICCSGADFVISSNVQCMSPFGL